jgi:hypothetical protein
MSYVGNRLEHRQRAIVAKEALARMMGTEQAQSHV